MAISLNGSIKRQSAMQGNLGVTVIAKPSDEQVSAAVNAYLEEHPPELDLPLAIDSGGTGATTVEGARENLGVPTIQYGVFSAAVYSKDNAESGFAETTVTFPKAFTSPPIVMVGTIGYMKAGDQGVIVRNETATHFVARTYSTTATEDTTINCQYIAIGY